MAVRKSMEETVSVAKPKAALLELAQTALKNAGFTNITVNKTMSQVSGQYHKLSVYGEILVTILPSTAKGETTINMKATSNVDNLFALFSSPNKKIIDKFKSNLNL